MDMTETNIPKFDAAREYVIKYPCRHEKARFLMKSQNFCDLTNMNYSHPVAKIPSTTIRMFGVLKMSHCPPAGLDQGLIKVVATK